MRFNLFSLQKKLELVTGKPVTQQEIADEAGLHLNTVYKLYNNKSTRVDLETMEKLIRFFSDRGLEIDAGDLFTTLKEEEEPQP